jgi:hypothetical protein
VLKPVAARLLARADALMKAPPLMVSLTKRGEPDLPGQLKGLEPARRLQGRVLTFAMAFLLTGDARYRDAAVGQLDHALADWPIWVDTAHQPPFDLMTGEVSLTFGLAWDRVVAILVPGEPERQGGERPQRFLQVVYRPVLREELPVQRRTPSKPATT